MTPKKTVYLPRTAYSGYTYTEWEKEYELPETTEEISRLIQIEAIPSISDVAIKGNVADVFGKNTFNILYQSAESGNVEPLSFSDDFSTGIDMKTNSENLFPFAKVFCTSVNCKVISPRKLYIKGKNKIHLIAQENVPEELPDINSGNNILFYNTCDFLFQEVLPPVTRTFSLEEELIIDSSYPSVERIVYSSVKIIPLDIVKSHGAAVVNASVIFKAFYESGGKYYLFSRSTPTSFNVENDEINEDTIVYYHIATGEQTAEKDIDRYGEDRVLRFFYNVELTLFRINEKSEAVPTDVFSPSDILKTENSAIYYNRLADVFSHPFTIEKMFEIPNTDISEIYDSSSVMDVESFEKTEEGGKINGICGISVLGKTENGIDSVNFNVNFSELIQGIPQCLECQCSIVPTQTHAMITGRNMITVRISGNAEIRRYESKSCKVVCDFVSKGAREARDKSCITFYYPTEKETLWDISKEYGMEPGKIEKENSSAFSPDGSISKGVKSIFIP